MAGTLLNPKTTCLALFLYQLSELAWSLLWLILWPFAPPRLPNAKQASKQAAKRAVLVLGNGTGLYTILTFTTAVVSLLSTYQLLSVIAGLSLDIGLHLALLGYTVFLQALQTDDFAPIISRWQEAKSRALQHQHGHGREAIIKRKKQALKASTPEQTAPMGFWQHLAYALMPRATKTARPGRLIPLLFVSTDRDARQRATDTIKVGVCICQDVLVWLTSGDSIGIFVQQSAGTVWYHQHLRSLLLCQ